MPRLTVCTSIDFLTIRQRASALPPAGGGVPPNVQRLSELTTPYTVSHATYSVT